MKRDRDYVVKDDQVIIVDDSPAVLCTEEGTERPSSGYRGKRRGKG